MKKKYLLLLGSSGDIGKAIYKKFENDNYQIHAPTSTELDLCDLKNINSYFKSIGIDYLDCFIFCAGINSPTEAIKLSDENLLKHLTINALAFQKISNCVFDKLTQAINPKILAVSSIYGSIGRSTRLPYCTSKHALNAMVKVLALEWGKDNIIVNSLSPGYVDTKMTSKNNTPKKIEYYKSKIALGRLATCEDIAKVAYFLCSENNRYITGQDIVVDGGFMAGGFLND